MSKIMKPDDARQVRDIRHRPDRNHICGCLVSGYEWYLCGNFVV
ncbi:MULTISPECIES: hypothetical protein [Emticicia]|nr:MULTISPECIES: hypothetical protein [Emticicia]